MPFYNFSKRRHEIREKEIIIKKMRFDQGGNVINDEPRISAAQWPEGLLNKMKLQ